MARVGVAFAASALSTYLIGDAMLRRRDALLRDNSRLHERVRARVTELVSYPEAIEVQIAEGVVRVSGHVLTAECDRLLSQLTQVPGVYRVYNALVSVDDAGAMTRAPFGNADPVPP